MAPVHDELTQIDHLDWLESFPEARWSCHLVVSVVEQVVLRLVSGGLQEGAQ